ncbi:DUF2946 family protein [Methylobacterium phyllostachyos]|nr:DUF2946 family protein [Methylobacterium phyllostachyos]
MAPLTFGSARRPTGLFGAALIALALWVQVLAPVGALRTMLAGPEGLSGAVLCGHAPDRVATDASDAQSAPAALGCALCQLCRAGLALPQVPLAPELARSLRWHVVAWPIPPPAGFARANRIAARPRAPPLSA